MKKYLAEFLGTAVIVLSGCIASVSVNIMVSALGFEIPMAFTTLACAFSFGLAVMVSYYCFSKISGGHFNPAVSLGTLITGDISVKEFFGYAISQILGGICGAAIASIILDTRTAMFASGFNEFSTFGVSMISAILLEVVLTFVFVYLFLAVTKDEKAGNLKGLIIGLGFTFVYLVETPMTGGGSNPAKSIAAAVIQEGTADLSQLWVFVIAPLLGAALAALLYIFFNGDKSKDSEDEIPEIDIEKEVIEIDSCEVLDTDEPKEDVDEVACAMSSLTDEELNQNSEK